MRNIAAIAALLFVVATASRAEAQQQATAETQTPANQRFEITPRGYVQFDWRGFPGWTVTPDTGRLEPDTLDVRRLRAGIDGRWRQWSFEASESSRWRTVTPLILVRSGRRRGESNAAAIRSRHGVERSHARSTT